MIYPTHGILLIDKNEGETSYEVVKKIKGALGIQKVGHAGTLDPFATGLLIILLGQGTKLSPFLMKTNKVYQATMRLGIETDTLDPTGRVVAEHGVPNLSLEFIQEKAKAFVGETEQTPPMFSAVKYKGTRAYKLARKGHAPVLKKRKVSIYSLDIMSADLPYVTIKVECAGGTYIRSLAQDLAKALGTVSHLCSLRRLSSGLFKIQDAVDSREITKNGFNRLSKEDVISLRDALSGMPEISVMPTAAKKIRQGNQPVLEDIASGIDLADCDGAHLKIVSGDELVAVVTLHAGRRDDHVSLEIARVFF